ncbi:hypothetical protein AAG570_010799 [Ranatra chinensis]|uniref:Uncharacterized protein n=1 Tax=Ranatra chinensis TaxID=642074 RepID=A0ABD0Z1L7_9HEMI
MLSTSTAIVCGDYGIAVDRHRPWWDIPSEWWRVSTLLVGLASALSLLVAVTGISAACIPDVVHPTTARIFGAVQLIAEKGRYQYRGGLQYEYTCVQRVYVIAPFVCKCGKRESPGRVETVSRGASQPSRCVRGGHILPRLEGGWHPTTNLHFGHIHLGHITLTRHELFHTSYTRLRLIREDVAAHGLKFCRSQLWERILIGDQVGWELRAANFVAVLFSQLGYRLSDFVPSARSSPLQTLPKRLD